MSTQAPTPLDIFVQEVESQFEPQLRIENLLTWSEKLQTELRQHMISSPQCMLPSFNYELPTGQEQGKYLAIEVGGSNLRMGLVDLNKRGNGLDLDLHYTITETMCFSIDMAVLQLKEYQFFDWMAERIGEMLNKLLIKATLPMGIAWSFPIESV